MLSQPYVNGIEDKVSHNFASSLTADLIPGEEDTATISVVCPDRWFLGDFAVVTSRGGIPFAGEVESMDVCTGEVTIRGVGRRAGELPRYPVSVTGPALRSAPLVRGVSQHGRDD
jgi:hypothetical protein